MARYVYYTNFLAAGQGKPSEAEINGHLTFLFFFKAIGVDAGEGSNERRFSVVDVAGSAENAHVASHNCRGVTQL